MQFKQNLMLGITSAFVLSGTSSSLAAKTGQRILSGHVPKVTANLRAQGRLAPAEELHLAIGLPLRDEQGLADFLTQLYDPASTNFHQFLTPEEFTSRFGPTEADYEAIKDFASTNGLTVRAAYKNRLLLDVGGDATSIEKAFQVKML